MEKTSTENAMNGQPLLSTYFVTVNYNCSNYTLSYLRSIEGLNSVGNSSPNVIIVDNASNIEDISYLESNISHKANVTLIKNSQNVGYFSGLNVGISAIPEDKHWCIIGNNDIEFDPSFLLALSNLSFPEDVLVLAPNIITKDGFHQNPHCVRRVSWIRKAGYQIYYTNYYLGKFIYWLNQKTKELYCAPESDAWAHRQMIYMGLAACYVLTENFFRFYKQLDDRVFLWGEEALLAGQVSEVGGKILYDPSIIVYHNGKKSVHAIPSKESYRINKQSYKIYSRYL